MSHIDPELRDALDRQSEGVRVVADLAERAIARDRSNRRRELGGAALVAGLVLAVAVPVGWGAVRGTTDHPLPVGPSVSTTAPTGSPFPSSTGASAPTPTTIPTLTANGAPAPVNARFATGPVTAKPTTPYIVGGVIHDGTKEKAVGDVAAGGYLASLAGGRWLVAERGTGEFRVLQPLGLPTVRLGTGKATVSTDGTLIVIERLGTLRAYDASGTWIRTLSASACDCAVSGADGPSPGFEAVGVIDSTVYANRGFTGASVAWDVVGGDTSAVKHRLALVDARTGTALTAQNPNEPSARTCHELIDLATDHTLWRLCGPLVFRSFSSDGRYLLATGYIDGLDESQLNPDRTFRYGGLVIVRTSDAAVVLEGGSGAPGTEGSPVTYTMSDDETFAVQVGSTTGQRNLQRCDLTGACVVVAPSRERDQLDIPEGDDPYYLSIN
jgi:hypothetical protein